MAARGGGRGEKNREMLQKKSEEGKGGKEMGTIRQEGNGSPAGN